MLHLINAIVQALRLVYNLPSQIISKKMVGRIMLHDQTKVEVHILNHARDWQLI